MQYIGCIDRMREALGVYDEDTAQDTFTVSREQLTALWNQADRELSNVYWAGQEETGDDNPNNTRANALHLFDVLWRELPIRDIHLAPDIMNTAIQMAITVRERIPHGPEEC